MSTQKPPIAKIVNPLGAAWDAVESTLQSVSEEPVAEARWLFQHLGYGASDRRWKAEAQLRPADLDWLQAACARRQQREPLQHILGTQPFRYLDLLVNRHVLIPRPETETLVQRVLDAVQKRLVRDGQQTPLRVLDVGAGSGAIALALKTECPALDVWATDLSEEALAVARQNAERVGAQVHFFQGDGLRALPPETPRFDVLVSNPPYIPHHELAELAPEVRDHEPQGALVPLDPDPLYFYRHFATLGPAYLKPGAQAFFEIHSALGPETVACFDAPHWHKTGLYQDLEGRDRYVESELLRVLE